MWWLLISCLQLLDIDFPSDDCCDGTDGGDLDLDGDGVTTIGGIAMINLMFIQELLNCVTPSITL